MYPKLQRKSTFSLEGSSQDSESRKYVQSLSGVLASQINKLEIIVFLSREAAIEIPYDLLYSSLRICDITFITILLAEMSQLNFNVQPALKKIF